MDYGALTEVFTLEEKHRDELKNKRGFSDHVIDALKFRSGGTIKTKNPDLPIEHRNAYKEDAVLIPYTTHEGAVEYLRPHKGGVKGEPLRIFCPWDIIPGRALPKKIVLAESEFKAVASCVMGMPAISVPGISSFNGKNFSTLADFLASHAIEEVIVCFDNEIKDNPEFPNYKKDYTKRYDTLIYSYSIAKKIEGIGLKSTIATLKKEWMINGKADIDGVLALGIPHNEYLEILNKAVNPKSYRSAWKLPKTHAGYVQRRIDRMFYDGTIEERIDGYYIFDGKNKNKRKITNFVIKVLFSRETSQGIKRTVKIIGAYGESREIELLPIHMASKLQFQSLCYELGDFCYDGKDEDLKHLWKYVFIHQHGRCMKELDFCGYAEEEKAYVFGNGAYYDGLYSPKDIHGIIWIKEDGFVLNPELIDDEEPSLCLLDEPVTDFSLVDIKKNLSIIVGEYRALILLSWILSHAFIRHIREDFKVFPGLFLSGKTGSGKTTIASWIGAFIGDFSNGLSFEGSTKVGLQRAMTQRKDIFIWMDEFRQKNENNAKINMLRSVYDKASGIKGTKEAQKTVSYPGNATLILSGEEMSQDSAFNSRFVPVDFHEINKDRESYEWMEANKRRFSWFFHKILSEADKVWPTVKDNIKNYIESMEDPVESDDGKTIHIENRIRLHYSILAGVGAAMFGPVGPLENFNEMLGKSIIQSQIARSGEEAINVFWEDVANLYHTQKINFPFYRFNNNDKEIYLHFSALFSVWEYYVKKDRSSLPVGKSILFKHITSLPCCMDGNISTRLPVHVGSIKSKIVKCIKLNLEDESLPMPLWEFSESLRIDQMDLEIEQQNLKELMRVKK